MIDASLERLIDYDGRRYWLSNGWCIRFSVKRIEAEAGRPFGIKYALTLHDAGMVRLMGFDNAHWIPRQIEFDHFHRFGRLRPPVPYRFVDADSLLVDFFMAVERACEDEDVPFRFSRDDIEFEPEDEGDEETR